MHIKHGEQGQDTQISPEQTPVTFSALCCPFPMQLTDTISSTWHRQGKSTRSLVPLPVVCPVPPVLEHRC